MKRLALVLLVGCGSPQRPPVVSAERQELERLERAWFVDGIQPAPGTCPEAPECAAGARLVSLYDTLGLPERAALVAGALGLDRRPQPPEIIEKIAPLTPPPPSVATRAAWRLGPGNPRWGTLTGDGPTPTRLDLEARLAAVLPGLRVHGVRPRVPGPGYVAQVEVPAHHDVLAPSVAQALGGVQVERIDPPTWPWHTAPASASVPPGGS